MTKVRQQQRSLHAAVLAPLALVCLAAAPHAHADSLLLAQTNVISGTESTLETFTAPTDGTVTISLQGITWPNSGMSALSFSVTSSSALLASWSGAGITGDTATFNVGAGDYFAHITGTATSDGLGLGLYSLMMTFAPAVPLPASGWMLLVGLFALLGLARVVRTAGPLEITGTAAA